MLFNSIEFLIFLPTVFILYWFVFNKNVFYQNILILVSSYYFYSFWDFRFLFIIILSTIFDYFIGLKIPNQKSDKNKRLLLYCSILFNLCVLGFFKYYNFFIDSWVTLLLTFGIKIANDFNLNIILPVGISFYTFQKMSYTIDIYKKKINPTKDFISFASFVSFFPQLVAGPIEKARNLLPQISNERKFKYEDGIIGLRLILWGFFKKVVIADSLAPIVDDIFLNYNSLDGLTLWLGAIYFSFQIYCDFSGYSSIAIGTSKLFGINLMTNFNFPYFSRNIREFWRKWHISLTNWFKEYLYFPLGGSFYGKWNSLRNTIIIFLLSGLWHGANWTFILWGLFHSILFFPNFISKPFKKYENKTLGKKKILISLKEFFQILITFMLVTFGWILFRSETINDSFNYIIRMDFGINNIHINPYNNLSSFWYLSYILFLIIVEWIQIKSFRLTISKTIIICIILTLMILFFIPIESSREFIYYQF